MKITVLAAKINFLICYVVLVEVVLVQAFVTAALVCFRIFMGLGAVLHTVQGLQTLTATYPRMPLTQILVIAWLILKRQLLRSFSLVVYARKNSEQFYFPFLRNMEFGTLMHILAGK